MNDVCTETRLQMLEDAESQVARCLKEYRENLGKPSRLARGESFRLAVFYRNSLLSIEQLSEMEQSRGKTLR